MRFFTPELYLRYNSTGDAEADRAEEEWELALAAYRADLERHIEGMNPRVRELAQSLCLHDAELLALREDRPDPRASQPSFVTEGTASVWMAKAVQFPFPVATLTARDGEQLIHLVYLLWDAVEQSDPSPSWPFSTRSVHWLYDEVVAEEGRLGFPLYRHRILLSDGRVLSIPFFDVVIESFSASAPEPALVTRRRA